MTSGPFDSPRLRLAGAHDNISRVEGAVKAFFAQEPHERVIEYDSDIGRNLHKVKLTKQPDTKLSLDVVHVAEDLRAALDHLGYACAIAGGAPAVATATHFPFADSAANLGHVIARGRCAAIPADIVTLFRSFQPYKGGDDLLWSINELANGGKHKVIMSVGHGGAGVAVNRIEVGKNKGGFMLRHPRWDAAKNELVVCEVGIGTEVDYDLTVTLAIVFGDIGALRNHEVLTTLRALASKVEGIIAATEAEAKRIGLIR